jgi:hypothetical protein
MAATHSRRLPPSVVTSTPEFDFEIQPVTGETTDRLVIDIHFREREEDITRAFFTHGTPGKCPAGVAASHAG